MKGLIYRDALVWYRRYLRIPLFIMVPGGIIVSLTLKASGVIVQESGFGFLMFLPLNLLFFFFFFFFFASVFCEKDCHVQNDYVCGLSICLFSVFFPVRSYFISYICGISADVLRCVCVCYAGVQFDRDACCCSFPVSARRTRRATGSDVYLFYASHDCGAASKSRRFSGNNDEDIFVCCHYFSYCLAVCVFQVFRAIFSEKNYLLKLGCLSF